MRGLTRYELTFHCKDLLFKHTAHGVNCPSRLGRPMRQYALQMMRLAINFVARSGCSAAW